MAEEYVFTVGETPSIRRTIHEKKGVAVSAATVAIYDAGGDPLTLASSDAQADPGNTTAKEQTVSYHWPTAGVAPGDYTAIFTITLSDQRVLLERVQLTVRPLFSQLDKWERKIRDLVLDTKVSDLATMLDPGQYQKAAVDAVRAFEKRWPRTLAKDFSLEAGVWEYPLPSGEVEGVSIAWDTDFSRLLELYYPWDPDDPAPVLLQAEHDYTTDESRSVWRLLGFTPGAGETARLLYTARHVLSHTVDTVPEAHVTSVAMYAAGLALQAFGGAAVRTTAPAIGGEFASYRTKQMEARQQGNTFLEMALKSWGKGSRRRRGAFPEWSYFPDQGRIVSYE